MSGLTKVCPWCANCLLRRSLGKGSEAQGRSQRAGTPKVRDPYPVPAWNAYSFAFGPVIAVLGILVLILILRWAFGRGSSVVAGPARSGPPSEYGVLVVIASPRTYIEGEIWRQGLLEAGLRANLAQTSDGPRLMVWPEDVENANTVLARLK